MMLEVLGYLVRVRGSCHRGSAQNDERKRLGGETGQRLAPRLYPIVSSHKILIPSNDLFTGPQTNLLLSLVIGGLSSLGAQIASQHIASSDDSNQHPLPINDRHLNKMIRL